MRAEFDLATNIALRRRYIPDCQSAISLILIPAYIERMTD
jgi:hypothetical protein